MNLLRLSLIATVALAVGPLLAPRARAITGDIWETNLKQILVFRPTPGLSPGTFFSNLSNPKGIVFDGNGHVFVADAGQNIIFKFNIFDASSTTFAFGLSSPVGLAFDQAGNLYESDAGTGTIFKFAPDGTKTASRLV